MSNTFGENLKQIREKNKWTLEEMAEKLGSTKQVLSRYERGERTPKITMAAHFAEVLEIPLRDLVGTDYESEISTNQEQPKTTEARILAKGVDKMPQAQREAIMNMMIGLYPGLFEKENHDDT